MFEERKVSNQIKTIKHLTRVLFSYSTTIFKIIS